MFTEVDLSVEHVLMFVIIVFLLYHLIGGCSCIRDGFSVGIQSSPPCTRPDIVACESPIECTDRKLHPNPEISYCDQLEKSDNCTDYMDINGFRCENPQRGSGNCHPSMNEKRCIIHHV